ncbi:BTB/POZ domain-containing protein KCTD6 isoform X1 [Exaiptasia diaphana]|uniref:BTB domain-containing protein n=1 Tax=Exaiptasia diaphana TaxID=2652724 RepID=A0A913XQE1_EXADI|nr:BTB/POZ domain-containing protein KCTD6 isoform X1 [Exaiptasia diaphana]
MTKGQVDFPDIINLNVGGHYYITKRSTLTKDNESMLAAMFSGRHTNDKDSEGRYFIDRDGTYFGYVLNFLRDNLEMPPASVALQVYKEAQFYQIRSLIEKLERSAQIFAIKLDEAKKSRLGNSFTKWKNTIVSKAQEKSLTNLTSSSRINFISKDDHNSLVNLTDCLGEMEHFIVIRSEIEKNLPVQDQSFESLRNRLAIDPDVIVDIAQSDMGMFVGTLQEDLNREGYSFKIWTSQMCCKNVKRIMNVCVEKCELSANEYFVQFEWGLPKEENKYENNDS